MKVFAKWFFGFWSDSWPCLTLNQRGATNFMRVALPGDRVVFVGAGSSETSPENRGRILGIAEVGTRPYRTADLVGVEYRRPAKEGASSPVERWPVAFAMTRAWRFDSPPKIAELFGHQLPSMARQYVAELSAGEIALLAGLQITEEPVHSSTERDEQAEQIEAVWGGRPTTGPLPTAWSGNVEATYDWPATTYVLRFGKRDVWKIGWAKSCGHRLRQVNRHIPFEALNERWELYDHEEWASPFKARDMEQSVLHSLKAFRTDGERVGCTSDKLERAWRKACAG